MTYKLTLDVDLDADPYALPRLLVACSRRRFRIHKLDFDAATGPQLELTVTGPSRHAERLPHWLANALRGNSARDHHDLDAISLRREP